VKYDYIRVLDLITRHPCIAWRPFESQNGTEQEGSEDTHIDIIQNFELEPNTSAQCHLPTFTASPSPRGLVLIALHPLVIVIVK
jgi:hypothetical protein